MDPCRGCKFYDKKAGACNPRAARFDKCLLIYTPLEIVLMEAGIDRLEA